MKTTEKAEQTTIIDPPRKAGKKQAVTVITQELPADPTLLMIDRAARDPDVDVDKMQRLLDMKKEVMVQLRKDEYQRAMNACQHEMQPVAKKAWNEQTKSHFAKLEHVDAAIRPIYTKHGFSLEFDSQTLENGDRKIICEVMHTSGYSKQKELVAPLDTSGPQGKVNKTSLHGLGSTISYLQRYLTLMIFNVVLKGIDNDGNGDPESKKLQEKKKDPFLNKAQNEKPDPDKEWEAADGVILGAKHQNLVYSVKETAPAQCIQAARYLIKVMDKHKTKASRVQMINDNLSLVRALVKGTHSKMVDELHACADKGE